jgi:UDP-N-acetylmuramoyl-tripeptide--D-alanyl-D-alanine ligase
VKTPDEAAAIVKGWIRPGDLVLFKASRGVRLERALAGLMEN